MTNADRALQLTCDSVEFIFEGSQLSYKASGDMNMMWAVFKVKDNKDVSYIYNPAAANPEKYRSKYSDEFVKKYYYLNEHNLHPSPIGNNCRGALDSFLYQVKGYQITDKELTFSDDTGKAISLIRN